MLINARHSDELRVAIIDNGILEAYEVEAAESGLTRGNIYRGVVAKIESSLNAAFIDYGAERHGFLPGDDIVSDAYHKKYGGNGRPKIADVLERGKPILVQVTKEAVGQKGAALTTSISLAGRYMVLTPFDDTRGVSRKVEDEQNRKRLREQMGSFTMPDGCGAIARTNAQDQSKTNLNRDLNALLRLWKRVGAELPKGKGPRLLYSDQDLVLQALRDYLDSSIEEVHVDDDDVLKKAEQYMRAFMPRARTQLIRYDGRIPLFARFHLDEQIDRIYDRTVQLPSGGSIVIDGTEALTAVDVNSGRTRGGNSHEDTVARTNLEAAAEVARQLRMRDIGGLVVVDFIDMRHRRNHRKVEKALRDAMKVDRARVSIGRISENGLLEINRQRIKQALQLRTHRPCPTCSGSGTIASPEFVGLSLLRRIEARAAAGDLRAVRIALHPELADGIQNNRRRELAQLEAEYGIRIEIVAATHLHRSEEQVEWKRGQGTKSEGAVPPRSAVAALTASDLMDGRSSRRRGRSRRAEEEETKQAESAPIETTPDEDRDGEEKKPRRRRRRRRRRRGSSGGDGGSQQELQDSQQQDSSQGDQAEDMVAEERQESKGSEQDGDEESTGRRRRRRRRGRSGSTRSRGDEDKGDAPEGDSQPQQQSAQQRGPQDRGSQDRGSQERSSQDRGSQERASRGRGRGRGKAQDDDNRGNREAANREGGSGTRRGRSGRSRRDSSGGSDQQPHWDTQPTQRKKGGNRPHVGIAPVKPTLPDQPPSEERIRQKFGQPWYLRPVAESARQEESAKREESKTSDESQDDSTQEDRAQKEQDSKPTRRRRSTRAKKEAETAEEAPSATEETSDEEKPKTRRRRSSTRSSTAKKAAEDEKSAAEPTQDDGAADAEEKPKARRRRSSTRSSSTEAASAKEEAADEEKAPATTDAEGEEKPETRRRRSSTRSSKAKKDTEATEAKPKAAEKSAESSKDAAEDDKPKTRGRRSSTRSSSTKAAKAKEESADEPKPRAAAEDEKKPKTRQRRSSTRSSKAKKEAEAEAKDDDAEEKTPTRRRRGSTRSTKTDDE
jgi:ribonuclease E